MKESGLLVTHYADCFSESERQLTVSCQRHEAFEVATLLDFSAVVIASAVRTGSCLDSELQRRPRNVCRPYSA